MWGFVGLVKRLGLLSLILYFYFVSWIKYKLNTLISTNNCFIYHHIKQLFIKLTYCITSIS